MITPGRCGKPRVKPFYSPPSLLLRQAASMFLFAGLARWRGMFPWLVREAWRSIPVSAGAVGMGCIGFPAHPAWEVTSACNLQCIHCHAAGGKPGPDEMDTRAAQRFISDLAEAQEFRMLVYTGGEPLVRRDIMDLFAYSQRVGFQNVIATNGTLIDDAYARELRKVGVVGAAISLDAPAAETHNFVRNSPKAFESALRGAKAVRKAGLLLQINVTAMRHNFDVLGEIIELAESLGAGIMLMYQLVPVGRGESMQRAALDLDENRSLLEFLRTKQRRVRTIVEPVAGPQYWPYLLESQGIGRRPLFFLARKLFHGCSAGRGFVYIKPNGEVWPCPFVPVTCGNVTEKPFIDIWRNAEPLTLLRTREIHLKGKCGDCMYNGMCGGCRGRAMALSDGDFLAEDKSCFLPAHPRGGG
jgi:AdoMet-dependent heme synthase